MMMLRSSQEVIFTSTEKQPPPESPGEDGVSPRMCPARSKIVVAMLDEYERT